jgi:hypothetical protein
MYLYETDVYFTYKAKEGSNRLVVGQVMVNTTFSIAIAYIQSKDLFCLYYLFL